MNDFEKTLVEMRRLSTEPGFQSFAEEYMRHYILCGNHEKIFGNHRFIYDDTERALRIVCADQPEVAKVFSRAMDFAKQHKWIAAAAILDKADSIFDSVQEIDGSPQSYAKPIIITFSSILVAYLLGKSKEE